MAEINTNTILIVLLIGGLAFLAYDNGAFDKTKVYEDENAQSDFSAENKDFCGLFTDNYPTFFFLKEIQCGAAGGDYVCDNNNMGCYDITTWDYSLCGDTQVQSLKAFCSAIGGEWTCTATEVSCESK